MLDYNTSKEEKPLNSLFDISTLLTLALSGPFLHHSMNILRASSVPSASTRTDLSYSLRMNPVIANTRAWLRAEYRNPTP